MSNKVVIDAKYLTDLTKKVRGGVDIEADVKFILEKCEQSANTGNYYCHINFDELSKRYDVTKQESNYLWVSALKDHIESLGLRMTNHCSKGNSFYTITWGRG